MNLLSRDDFRESVFKRDGYKCVMCGDSGKLDAHHIVERRLFSDGGYYIDNGVSLCEPCHLKAESTEITCEELRQKARIQNIVLPDDFYDDCRYDKWGNIYIGLKRTKGPLFFDESVQKIIKGDFTDYVKYPRTWHLPWTGSTTKDDRILKDTSQFLGQNVVVTEKLDGENCLEENTKIHTEIGEKEIKWICDNKFTGKVLSFNDKTGEQEFQPVLDWNVSGNCNSWFEITLEDGKALRVTSEHRVWLPKLNCYRRVIDLKEGDDVLLER